MADAIVGMLRVSLGLDSAQFLGGVQRAQAATTQLQGTFVRLQRSAQGGAGGLQNFGFQIQDFAVQISAGTSATQALAQQLPQLLSGFGAVGIVMGTVAAIGIPVARALFNIGSAAEDAEKQMAALASSADEALSAVRAANATPEDLAEDYGIEIAAARELLRLRAELAVFDADRDVDAASASVRDLAGDFTPWSGEGALVQLRERARLLAEIEEQQRLSDAAIAANDRDAQAAASARIAELMTQTRASDNLNDRMIALGRTLGLTGSAVEDLAVALASVDDNADPSAQAAAWGAVQQAILDAVGGVENLNDEGRALLDWAIEAQGASLKMATAMAEMEAFDIAAPFEGAFGALDRLVNRIGDGLRDLRGWGGALGDFLAGFSGGELGDALSAISGITDGVDAAAALLQDREGFREVPYDDGARDANGNRVGPPVWRAGWGSDTITLSDGTIQRVTQGMRVTRADADRDLMRRITTEFMPAAARAVGEDLFRDLLPAQQAVLTSLAYNYGAAAFDAGGRLAGVAAAVRDGGNADVAAAIRALGEDNGGINRERRNLEAGLYQSTAGSEAVFDTRRAEEERAAAEAAREAERAAAEAARQAEADARATAAAREADARAAEAQHDAYQRLAQSMDPLRAAQAAFEEGQRLVNAELEAGRISAEEHAWALEQLAARQAQAIAEATEGANALSDAAQTGAERMSDLFMSILDGSTSAKEAIGQLLLELAKVQLQQAFLGLAGADGPIGDIFSALGSALGGGKGAGGDVMAGSAYLIGEHGPEAFVPRVPGRIVPNHRLGSLSGRGGEMAISVNVAGARGNQEIEAMVMSGVRQGLAAYDSRLPGRVRELAGDPRRAY